VGERGGPRRNQAVIGAGVLLQMAGRIEAVVEDRVAPARRRHRAQTPGTRRTEVGNDEIAPSDLGKGGAGQALREAERPRRRESTGPGDAREHADRMRQDAAELLLTPRTA